MGAGLCRCTLVDWVDEVDGVDPWWSQLPSNIVHQVHGVHIVHTGPHGQRCYSGVRGGVILEGCHGQGERGEDERRECG